MGIKLDTCLERLPDMREELYINLTLSTWESFKSVPIGKKMINDFSMSNSLNVMIC